MGNREKRREMMNDLKEREIRSQAAVKEYKRKQAHKNLLNTEEQKLKE